MSGVDWKKEALALAHKCAITNLDLGVLLSTYEKNMKAAGLFSPTQRQFCAEIKKRIVARDTDLDEFEKKFFNDK